MKNFKRVKNKFRKILSYIAVFVIVLNSSFISEIIPEAEAVSSDLFFSEYIEGSSNNKALEIYNNTGASINLSGYSIDIYFNGSNSSGATIDLSGTLPSGNVYVVCNSSADSIILSHCNQASNSLTFNGDDAVVLKNVTTIIDVIGQIGVDPGTEWGTGLTSTQDNTLVRKCSVTQGDSNGGDSFDPALEWDGYIQDTFAYLGSINCDVTAPTVLSISSVQTSPTNIFPINIIVTFSEPVIGFTIDDLSAVTNGVVGNFSGSGATYTFDVNPSSEGVVTIDLAGASGITDLAGNPYVYNSSDQFSIIYDTTPPEITNQSASPNPFSPNGDFIKDTTDIAYKVSEDAYVTIGIYDLSNNLLRTLLSGELKNGNIDYTENWDGKDSFGIKVTDGNYKAVISAVDLAGNPSIDYSVDVIVDTQGPPATSGSSISTGNITNNNNPIVRGKYSIEGEVTSDLRVLGPDTERVLVVFEKENVQYQKEATLDGLGNYTTENSNQYSVVIVGIPSVSVLPDGLYKVKALAIDAAGNSTPEIITNALTIDTVIPNIPSNLQVIARTPNSITLSWAAATDSFSGIGGYKVYYGTQSGVYNSVRDVGNTTTTTISGLSPSKTYYFIVKAYDKAGNESFSSNEVSEVTSLVLEATKTSNSVSSESKLGGIVESAQAAPEEKQEENNSEEQKTQTKGRNYLLWLAIIILIAGSFGLYYYNKHSEKLRRIKFPKLPGMK